MGVRQRLAQILAERGMTQTALAERLGEPPSWVNNRIHGVAAIKADELPRLAAGLGVPIVAFFEESAPGVGPGYPSPSTDRQGFVEAVAEAVARALWQMPEGVPPALSRPAWPSNRPEPGGPPPAPGLSPERRRAIALRATRDLARAWKGLPEEEQQTIWEFVEARRRARERAEEGHPEAEPTGQ